MEFPDKYPAPLRSLVISIAESLTRNGLDPQEAERISFDAADTYRKTHGGETLYIPTGYFWEMHEQHKAMWEAFNGNNYDELAQQYGMTPRQVRRIIVIIQESEVARRQADLFQEPEPVPVPVPVPAS